MLVLGDPSLKAPLVRIHSQCITGEALRSLRCDCGEQLELAMAAIGAEGCGLLIYEQQEGRGIGLMAKLQAYALQDGGLDTIAANHALGFEADCRDFMLPADILNHLGIRQFACSLTILTSAARWPRLALWSWSRFRARLFLVRTPWGI